MKINIKIINGMGQCTATGCGCTGFFSAKGTNHCSCKHHFEKHK